MYSDTSAPTKQARFDARGGYEPWLVMSHLQREQQQEADTANTTRRLVGIIPRGPVVLNIFWMLSLPSLMFIRLYHSHEIIYDYSSPTST